MTEEGDTVRVTLRGELDVMVAGQVGEVIRRHLAAGRPQLIDLSEVVFIDSTGLAAIVKSAPTEAERALMTLRRSRHHQANRLFALTGTDRLFRFEAEPSSEAEPASDTNGTGPA
ncbi:MAG TPA: STAS domain-containing protein [Solirubrobacteraceae bacterium]|nr:STAS domain-containing protein [Solirubrobacteraceae bacterium]